MSNHTPGPWSIKDDGPREVLKDANGNSLLIFESWTPDDVRPLIAAAPGLLEALKRVEITFGDLDPSSYSHGQHVAIKMARAAIAKAEGR